MSSVWANQNSETITPQHLINMWTEILKWPVWIHPKKNSHETSRFTRFRLFPFRSPLLGESLLFSLPLGTEMFHFPRSSSTTLCIQVAMLRHRRNRLPHSEISGSQVAYHLPEAYRRLLRPSSPFSVKASTICPCVWSQECWFYIKSRDTLEILAFTVTPISFGVTLIAF
jgi:hypothetical protein